MLASVFSVLVIVLKNEMEKEDMLKKPMGEMMEVELVVVPELLPNLLNLNYQKKNVMVARKKNPLTWRNG